MKFILDGNYENAVKPRIRLPIKTQTNPNMIEFFLPIILITLEWNGEAKTPAKLKQQSIHAIDYVFI